MKIYLADIKPRLRVAWKQMFKDTDVEVNERGIGSIFDLRVDAWVSPANSWGFMDGGIDGLYTEALGPGLQKNVQQKIKDEFHGELLVGQALAVSTGDGCPSYVISAPTMRVPTHLPEKSVNVFLATRAALRVAKDLFDSGKIQSVAFPGMGTGIGGVSPERCALQMREAYNHAILGETVPFEWTDVLDHESYLFTGLKRTNQVIDSHDDKWVFSI